MLHFFSFFSFTFIILFFYVSFYSYDYSHRDIAPAPFVILPSDLLENWIAVIAQLIIKTEKNHLSIETKALIRLFFFMKKTVSTDSIDLSALTKNCIICCSFLSRFFSKNFVIINLAASIIHLFL